MAAEISHMALLHWWFFQISSTFWSSLINRIFPVFTFFRTFLSNREAFNRLSAFRMSSRANSQRNRIIKAFLTLFTCPFPYIVFCIFRRFSVETLLQKPRNLHSRDGVEGWEITLCEAYCGKPRQVKPLLSQGRASRKRQFQIYSIVAGGFGVKSYKQRLTPFIWVILSEIRLSLSQGSWVTVNGRGEKRKGF